MSGTVLCTGGVSYFVIRGDGTVYRCLFNPQAIGNIGNLEQIPLERMACHHKNSTTELGKTCHPDGDLMFATTWEDGGIHRAPWAATKWTESENPETASRKNAFFIILPVNSKCNFRCPYCCNYYHEHPDGRITGRPKDHWSDLPIEAWSKFISLCDSMDFTHCGFLGGEPTLYPHLHELIARLSKVGTEIGVCTNLSNSVFVSRILDLAERNEVGPGLSISASLHPVSPGFSWGTFLDNATRLAKARIRIRATMVAWPEQLRTFPWLKDRLGEVGVTLRLKGIGGYKIDHDDLRFAHDHGASASTFEFLDEIGWFQESEERVTL